ncbi:hypothetical protein LIA77_09046 [Sarocladium implicatum]|nr:hypothetical protein LIA77_09046 [Sarocladium implicatum]
MDTEEEQEARPPESELSSDREEQFVPPGSLSTTEPRRTLDPARSSDRDLSHTHTALQIPFTAWHTKDPSKRVPCPQSIHHPGRKCRYPRSEPQGLAVGRRYHLHTYATH